MPSSPYGIVPTPAAEAIIREAVRRMMLQLNPLTQSVAGSSANVANTLVKRDGSGNFAAGTITATLTGNVTGNVTGNLTGNVTGNVTGNLTGNVTGNCSGTSGSTTGNAATATKLATARNINGVAFDGTAAITITAATPQVLTAGTYLTSTGTFDGSTARTFAVDATSASTASKVVARDASGDFAGRYTGAIRKQILSSSDGVTVFATIGDTGASSLDIWCASAIPIRFLNAAFTTTNMSITDGGTVTINTLAGVGTRAVKADASGVLSAP